MRTVTIERDVDSTDLGEPGTPREVEVVTKDGVTAAELVKARAVDAYWGGIRAAALRLQIQQLRRGRVLGSSASLRSAIAAAEGELAEAAALARGATAEEMAAARVPTKDGQRMAGLGEWLQGVALVEMIAEDTAEVVMGEPARELQP